MPSAYLDRDGWRGAVQLWWVVAGGAFVVALFDLDDWLTRRHLQERRAVWDPAAIGGVSAIAGSWTGICRALFANVSHVQNVGFSVLEGGSHIKRHADPNRGALRLQVPIHVPGTGERCAIDIDGEIVNWQEGEPLLFDLAAWHEAWNDAPGARVVLAAEVEMPLPFPLSLLNRLVQRQFRRFPSYRGLPERIEDAERSGRR